MPEPTPANNGTTFRLAALAMLLSIWMIGRASEPDAPLPPATDEQTDGGGEVPALLRTTRNDPPKDAKDSMEVPHVAPGRVLGMVVFVGERPEPKVIDLNADAYCQAYYDGKPSLKSERWVIAKDGAMANVLVHVTGGLPDRAWSPPPEAKVVTVQGCRFVPHVTAMMLGQWVEYHNLDETMHSVHLLPKINAEMGVGQSAPPMPLFRWQPARPEVGVVAKCDAHAWMNAHLHILPHPFFDVSDVTGSFEISNLPPGEYELSAWHEAKKTTASQSPIKVKVESGRTTQVRIEMNGD